ncbi:MAG TPA: hypothetical protein V6C81_16605 [Planktothrix sp.]|jgi:hypothetical protein
MNFRKLAMILALSSVACAFFCPESFATPRKNSSVLRVEATAGSFAGGGYTAYFSENAIRVEIHSGYTVVAHGPDWAATVFTDVGRTYCTLPRAVWEKSGLFSEPCYLPSDSKIDMVVFKKVPCRRASFNSVIDDMYMQVRSAQVPATMEYYVTDSLPCGKEQEKLFSILCACVYLNAMPIYEKRTGARKSSVDFNVTKWYQVPLTTGMFTAPSGYERVSTLSLVVNSQSGKTIRAMFGDDEDQPQAKVKATK